MWQSPGSNSHPSCCLLPSVSKAACKQPQILCHSTAYHLHHHQFWDAARVKYPESPCKVPCTLFPFNSTFQSRSLSPSSTTTALCPQMERCSPCPVSTLPQQAPCWDVNGALQKMSGRGRGEGRGYHKEIKNANHVLSNDLPPELSTGCRQGFLYIIF